ncbi:MAG: N-6 DNA methylase, partial [Planctomycetes bacterium]|nr:N-6 DNA methylase [Planctomycetota bacterium]
MNADAIIRQLERGVLAAPPAGISRAQIERFFRDQHASLVTQLKPLVQYIAKRQAAKDEVPPDEWTPAKRTAANLAAMKIAAANESGETLSNADRAALRRYSGWGGLSVKDNLDKMPPQWRVGSASLINEYYTPSRIARDIVRALCPYLEDLKNRDGELIALEPSVGIGRFVDALDRVQCEQDVPAIRWLATELNEVSARLFALLHPDVEFQQGTFEQWVVDHYSRYSSRIGLVLSNPPFGQRYYKKIDQDEEYNETRADAYFLRRGLDMLKPGGIGVFMVPSGVLSGRGDTRDVREKLLRHNHLMGAFRLPMKAVPGALLIIDIQFWRARDGVLTNVDSADEYILEGRYFEEHKDHVLGKEVGSPTDTGRGRFSYKVEGTYEKLPRLIERPMCSACELRPRALREAPRKSRVSAVRERASTEGLNPALASAVELGMRVLEYLREKSAGTERGVLLHAALNQALLDFQSSQLVSKHKGNTNPWQWIELRQLADGGNAGAQGYLQAFTKAGALVYALTSEPTVVAKWPGDPDDIVAQADTVYKSRRELTINELASFHESVGGRLERTTMFERLHAADWCFDNQDEQTLVPLKDYITGDLWPRHDLAARLAKTSAQWMLQFERLRGALKLATWTDIAEDASPTQGWVPIDLLSEWMSETQNEKYGAIELVYREGLYQFKNVQYADTDYDANISWQAVLVLGWLNHDNVLFAPGAMPPRINRDLK